MVQQNKFTKLTSDPEELHMKELWETLRSYGISGIEIIGFSKDIGPYLKYYAVQERNEFLDKLKTNPTFAAEMCVIGKHIKEFKTHQDFKGLIYPYGKGNKRFIIFELAGRKKVKARQLLLEIVKNIDKGTAFEIKKAFKQALE